MVNWTYTFGVNPARGRPDVALALGYARRGQGVLQALFALDATLARLTLGTREPLVAQMRLTWWRDALLAPVPPAHPILRALDGAGRAPLLALVDGWEKLLDPARADGLEGFAGGRGALFAAAVTAIGAADDVTDAGRGWALADLSTLTADAVLAARAAAAARPLLARAAARRWSGAGRALGALVHLARIDLAHGGAGAGAAAGARRVARIAWHRATGW